MPMKLKRPLSVALGALATTMLGGCYYGDVQGVGYASGGDCAARYGNSYYDYDGYAYDDGYGYDCYDASDYGAGFAQIGFGGGWYDDYYYPGYGMWMFDNYRNRYPLRGGYLDYWGGRRAWWKHHGGRNDWKPGRPGGWNRGDGDGRPGDGRPGRPGGWNRGDGNNDGPRGTRPGRGPDSGNPGSPPVTGNPGRPDWGAGRPRPGSQGEGNVGRPRPNRPMPGGGVSSPGSTDGAGRPVRTRPAPSAMPDRPPRAERPAPAYRPPAQQSAPSPRVERPTPDSRGLRSEERPD